MLWVLFIYVMYIFILLGEYYNTLILQYLSVLYLHSPCTNPFFLTCISLFIAPDLSWQLSFSYHALHTDMHTVNKHYMESAAPYEAYITLTIPLHFMFPIWRDYNLYSAKFSYPTVMWCSSGIYKQSCNTVDDSVLWFTTLTGYGSHGKETD